MKLEINLTSKILRIKNECNKVRCIQHILSKKIHIISGQYSHNGNEKQQAGPRFGSVFTDHMLKMEYDKKRGGWQQPRITKFENLSLHPAAKVLHYATTLFEGMKVYRGVDGKIRLFRPLLNLQRLNQSAERACLPKVDIHELLRQIEKLIRVDENFIPFTTDGSLYIRPTIIGIDPILGISTSTQALLYVILSPCSSYFDNGSKGIRLYADPSYVRAWEGGVGNYKMGSNYAPTLYVQEKATKFGCQQALWLYGKDEQLTEAGTMALFTYYINDRGEYELRTAPLNGLILPSITRKSLLELSKEWNEFNVEEKPMTMNELLRLNEENRLLELFGAGTASHICPVSEIYYRGRVIRLLTTDHVNPLYKRFYETLRSIFYGKMPHRWAYEVGGAQCSTYASSIGDYHRVETAAM